MGGEIGVAHQRAYSEPSVGSRFDLVERKTIDVDQMPRCLDLEFHQIEEICAACNELGGLDPHGS
jgi:hypothetical protein